MLTRLIRSVIQLACSPFVRIRKYVSDTRRRVAETYWALRGWGDVIALLSHCTLNLQNVFDHEADAEWNSWLARRGGVATANAARVAGAELQKSDCDPAKRQQLQAQVDALRRMREDFEARAKPLWTLAGLVEWFVLDVLRMPTCGCSARRDKLNAALPIHPPRIGIVLPHYKDRRALWGTLLNLRDQVLDYGLRRYVEIVVVDQSPIIEGDPKHQDGTPYSPLSVLCKEVANSGVRVTWIAYPEPVGTAPAKRQGAIEAGKLGCRWVLIIDCHVWWQAGRLKQLLRWLRKPKNVDSAHVYHGALLDCTGSVVATHQTLFRRDGTPNIGADLVWGSWAVDPKLKEIVGKPRTAEIESGPGFCVLARVDIAQQLYHPHVRGHGDPEGFISRRHLAGNILLKSTHRREIHLHGLLDFAHNFVTEGAFASRSPNSLQQQCKNHCIECCAQHATLQPYAARVTHAETRQPHPSFWSLMRAEWAKRLPESELVQIEQEVSALGHMVPPYFGPPVVVDPLPITLNCAADPAPHPFSASPTAEQSESAPLDRPVPASSYTIFDDAEFMRSVHRDERWASSLSREPLQDAPIDRLLAICCLSGDLTCASSVLAQFLAQTDRDSDLLLIMDGGDGTIRHSGDEHGRRVTIASMGHRATTSDKHRYAMQLAQGENYPAVAIMDDDDYYAPEYLARHRVVLQAGADWSAPNRAYYCHASAPDVVTIENAEHRWHAAWAFRVALYRQVGGYPQGKWTEFDTDLGALFNKLRRPVDPWSHCTPQHVYRFGILRPSSSGIVATPGQLPASQPLNPSEILPRLDPHAARLIEQLQLDRPETLRRAA